MKPISTVSVVLPAMPPHALESWSQPHSPYVNRLGSLKKKTKLKKMTIVERAMERKYAGSGYGSTAGTASIQTPTQAQVPENLVKMKLVTSRATEPKIADVSAAIETIDTPNEEARYSKRTSPSTIHRSFC